MPLAPAPAPSRSAGKAALARRLGPSPSRTTSGWSVFWCKPLRRPPDDLRRAGGRELKPTAPAGGSSGESRSYNPEAWLPPSGGRISRRWLLHDCRRHRRTARRLRLEASCRTSDLRTRPHGIDVFERQRRLRDRVLDARLFTSHECGRAALAPSCRPTASPACSKPSWMPPKSVYNSLLKAVDTTGNGRTVRALPIDGLKTLLKIHIQSAVR